MCFDFCLFFFFSSRRRHTRSLRDWSSDVCSSDLSGARRFLARLWRALTPSSLFASHVGVGGSTGSFSTFTWSFVPEIVTRSEERRVGKECRDGGWRCQ